MSSSMHAGRRRHPRPLAEALQLQICEILLNNNAQNQKQERLDTFSPSRMRETKTKASPSDLFTKGTTSPQPNISCALEPPAAVGSLTFVWSLRVTILARSCCLSLSLSLLTVVVFVVVSVLLYRLLLVNAFYSRLSLALALRSEHCCCAICFAPFGSRCAVSVTICIPLGARFSRFLVASPPPPPTPPSPQPLHCVWCVCFPLVVAI